MILHDKSEVMENGKKVFSLGHLETKMRNLHQNNSRTKFVKITL